jgi:hypothetical protein
MVLSLVLLFALHNRLNKGIQMDLEWLKSSLELREYLI